MIQSIFFYHGAAISSGPRPPHYRGFVITLIQTHHTRQDSSGRVISPTQRPLPDTQHSLQTEIHAPGGIRTHNPSKQAAADPRLRTHGHWDRQSTMKSNRKIHPITGHVGPEVEQSYSCTLSLTTGLNKVGWSTPRPGRFASRERPGTHLIGGWVDPRARLDGCVKSRPHRDSIPRPSSSQLVAIPTKLSRPTVKYYPVLYSF